MARGYVFCVSEKADTIPALSPEDFYENDTLTGLGEYFETAPIDMDFFKLSHLPVQNLTDTSFQIRVSEIWRQDYFQNRLDQLREMVSSITLKEFLQRNTADRMSALINDTASDMVYYNDTIYTFDDFLRIADPDLWYSVSRTGILIH